MPLIKQSPLIGKWITNAEELNIAQTYAEKKLGQFDKKDMQGLVEVMAQWKVLLGLNTLNSQDGAEELRYICQFIYDNFKYLTLSDIIMARDWAICGRIDMSYVSNRNINAYYVSRAINAYEDEKRMIVNRLDEKRQTFIREVQRNTITQLSAEDKANQMKDILVNAYKNYKNGGLLYDFGDFIYNWLKKTKQIANDKALIEQAYIYANDKLRKEKQENPALKNLYISLENKTESERKNKYAREYIIIQYFDKFDIEQILKKINIKDF